MAPRQALYCENYSFMTCLLWVDTSSSGWQKDVQKVLMNIHEVTTFRMNGLGMVEVSGTVNPQKLMKKLGKKLAIVWFQFGDCAANLFMPPTAANLYESGWGYGGGGGGGLCDGRENAKVTRCRVADVATTAAEPSAPPLPGGGGGISGCCLM